MPCRTLALRSLISLTSLESLKSLQNLRLTSAKSKHLPNLSSKWCIYNARPEKQRRAVLAVLPFVGLKGSGRKCAAITANNLLSERGRYNARQKYPRWAVLSYCSLRVLFVSGSRCRAMTTNYGCITLFCLLILSI